MRSAAVSIDVRTADIDCLAQELQANFRRIWLQLFQLQRLDGMSHDRAVAADLTKQIRMQPHVELGGPYANAACHTILGPGIGNIRQQRADK
jgi:hypothetical protein